MKLKVNACTGKYYKITAFFPSNLKDSVSAHRNSFLIYQFKCKRDVRYIGCRDLKLKINQHVPSVIWLHSRMLSSSSTNQKADPAIAQRLIA